MRINGPARMRRMSSAGPGCWRTSRTAHQSAGPDVAVQVRVVLLVLGFGIRAFHTDETGKRCPVSSPTATR